MALLPSSSSPFLYLLFALLLLFAAAPARAEVFTVCPTCTYTTISAAVAEASANDPINVEAGNYTEASTSIATPLTLNFNSGVSIFVSDSSAPWLVVEADLIFNVTGTIRLYNAAIDISTSGSFTQTGDIVSEVTSGAFGVSALGFRLDGGVWNQYGSVTVKVTFNAPEVTSDPNQAAGVEFMNLGTWDQVGSLSVSIDSNASYCSGVKSSIGQATWLQKGNLKIDAICNTTETIGSVAGVTIANSYWVQDAEAEIRIRGRTVAIGVLGSSASSWAQNQHIRIGVDSPNSNGVQLQTGGKWFQSAPVTTTLSGVKTGFLCSDSGDWACKTANLTNFLGGYEFSPSETPSCLWTMAYVPQLPSDFDVRCDFTFNSTAMILPRSVVNKMPPTCGVGVMPTIEFSDVSPQKWVKGFSYALRIVADDLTFLTTVFTTFANTGARDSPPSFGLTNGAATSTYLFISDLGSNNTLLLAPSSGPSFSVGVKNAIPLTLASSGLLSSDGVVKGGNASRLPLALDFNSTALTIAISPRDATTGKANRKEALSLSSFAIDEVNYGGQVVRTVNIPIGNWTFSQTADRDIQSLISFDFTTNVPLEPTDDNSTIPSFGMRWYLFDRVTNVSLPTEISDVPLSASPQLAKMTMTLSPSWPWLASDNTLRVRMTMKPAVKAVTAKAKELTAGGLKVTSYTFAFDTSDETTSQAEVRVLSAGLAVNETTLAKQRVGVSHAIKKSTSELMVEFSHFEGQLIYDPDFSVLAGAKGGESSDNNAVTIAVAVVVPVAVVLVVAVIVAVVVAGVVSKRKRVNKHRAINFEHGDGGL